MTDPNEFTPKEKYLISLYKDPARLFANSLSRALQFLLPSIGLVIYSYTSGDESYGLLGYGLLLFRSVYQLINVSKGTRSIQSIINKYEAQLQAKRDVP